MLLNSYNNPARRLSPTIVPRFRQAHQCIHSENSEDALLTEAQRQPIELPEQWAQKLEQHYLGQSQPKVPAVTKL